VRRLLDEFEALGLAYHAVNIYTTVLSRSDVQKTSAAKRRELLLWHAQAIQPNGDSRPARWASLLSACELLPAPNSRAAEREIQQLVIELRAAHEATADFVTKLIAQSQIESHRQELRSVLSDKLLDLTAATAIDWKLHEAGFPFQRNLSQVLLRMNQANQYEKTIVMAESRLRKGLSLESVNRELLADAYQKLNRPQDARRIRSTPPVP
jgi:hypothetical protein